MSFTMVNAYDPPGILAVVEKRSKQTQQTRTAKSMTQSAERSEKLSNHAVCPTGVPGLDEVLRGGLPRNRLYLLEGEPGAGKTTLALQFLFEGARQGESVLYITLSESKEELQGVAESHGWSLDDINVLELSAIEQQLQIEAENTFFHPSEVELGRVTQILLAEIERTKPSRVVFDSLSELRLMSETALRYRRQVLRLKQFFTGKECTVLVLDDRSADTKDLQVQSLAHGVLSLEHSSPDYGVARRHLNIVKIRGRKYREGFHDFVIQKGGVVIFPRPEVSTPIRMHPRAAHAASTSCRIWHMRRSISTASRRPRCCRSRARATSPSSSVR